MKNRKIINWFLILSLLYSFILASSSASASDFSNLKLDDFSEFESGTDSEYIDSIMSDSEIRFDGQYDAAERNDYERYRLMIDDFGNCSDFKVEITMNYNYKTIFTSYSFPRDYKIYLIRKQHGWLYTPFCIFDFSHYWNSTTKQEMSSIGIRYSNESYYSIESRTDLRSDDTTGSLKFTAIRKKDVLTCEVFRLNEIILSENYKSNSSVYFACLSINVHFATSDCRSIGNYSISFTDFHANLGFPKTALIGTNTIIMFCSTFLGLLIILFMIRKIESG